MPSSRKFEMLLLRLCKATEQQAQAMVLQAQAIDRLASSNEELVDALMQDEDKPDEEEGQSKFDMAGRPLDS